MRRIPRRCRLVVALGQCWRCITFRDVGDPLALSSGLGSFQRSGCLSSGGLVTPTTDDKNRRRLVQGRNLGHVSRQRSQVIKPVAASALRRPAFDGGEKKDRRASTTTMERRGLDVRAVLRCAASGANTEGAELSLYPGRQRIIQSDADN